MSSEAKHTKNLSVDFGGPCRLGIIDNKGRTVAFCNLQTEDGDEDEANAVLFAAAPDLLDENIEARTLLGLPCVLALQDDLKGVQEIARKLKIGMRGGCPFIESPATVKAEGSTHAQKA